MHTFHQGAIQAYEQLLLPHLGWTPQTCSPETNFHIFPFLVPPHLLPSSFDHRATTKTTLHRFIRRVKMI